MVVLVTNVSVDAMNKLTLDGALDLKIGKHISLVIDDEGITVNDFSEKSELMVTHRIDGLEIKTIEQVRTICLTFEDDVK